MNAYDIETFQKEVLEKYFQENAPIGVRTRREDKKMTMNGCWEWIKSKIQRIASTKGGVAVTDNDFVYNEMMAYFTECEEGDKYRTEEEIENEKRKADEAEKREEERKIEEEKDRKKKAEMLWNEHKKRIERWAGMSQDQIKCEIYRKHHTWLDGKTDSEILDEIERDNERKAEQAKKCAELKAKEEAKRMKEKMKNAQMDFGF